MGELMRLCGLACAALVSLATANICKLASARRKSAATVSCRHHSHPGSSHPVGHGAKFRGQELQEQNPGLRASTLKHL